MTPSVPTMRNGQVLSLTDIPVFDEDSFAETLAKLLAKGRRVCAYFGDRTDSGEVKLYAVCADDRNGALLVISALVKAKGFPSLTPRFPQVHLFEREIHEQTGLIPDGHPWLKPVRFPQRTQQESAGSPPSGQIDFFRVHGEEIHEVSVGPVHAGIIEPGHFRFQCHGETVFHLEISLGYQHRGIEAAMAGGPFPVTPFQMEAIAGDSTIGHMSAYCHVIESLSGCKVSANASMVRAMALELERCANHVGDLGALAGDIGFLPTMSYCGRIRGDYLNMTAMICGNRFGRGLVVPGGVGMALDEKRKANLSLKLQGSFSDFLSATSLLWEDASVITRFESAGKLTRETAESIGLVGPARRASGCFQDVRQDHAYGFYRFAHIPVCTHDSGDVFSRAHVRWREVQASTAFLLQHLSEAENPKGARHDLNAPEAQRPAKAAALAVSLVEGWRGEICHVAITDKNGRFRRYKIVDPSFHNWFGLALSLRDQQISDFPLINKSFNLSYCGFDL
jgi:Ni,Fe-hydrogenase III large subunit